MRSPVRVHRVQSDTSSALCHEGQTSPSREHSSRAPKSSGSIFHMSIRLQVELILTSSGVALTSLHGAWRREGVVFA